MAELAFPHAYGAVRDELLRRLNEPPGHLVQLLAGPRQVGKTTLLLELEQAWPGEALYAAADTPAAMLPGWWERLWADAEIAARAGPVLVLLDEVPYLPDWPRLLKAKVDETKRMGLPIHIVATGSSALSVGRGSRETLAGRFERLRLLHWQAAEIALRHGKEPLTAARDIVAFGGYPGAVRFETDPERWRAYVRDSIVAPAIGRDLLAIEPVRKPALLRQVYAVAVGHPGRILSLQKIRGQLQDAGALETVAHYLHLLEEACLVAAVRKYSAHVLRRRDAQPERWGFWVENACLAAAWNAGQEVHYWREEPLEVDLVSTGSWGRWAVEVKTGPLSVKALAGVLEFCRRNPGFQPAVLCDPGQESIASGAGVVAKSWPRFLVAGLSHRNDTRP